MKEQIIARARELQAELVDIRRDFHKYAESGWTEFRTAALIAQYLEDLGYDILIGDEVIDESAMMGLPTAEALTAHMARAKEQGAPAKYVDQMVGGKTGVVVTLDTGKPGPVVGLRFDIDANDMNEATTSSHRPHAEGFASVNLGAMHACGHDGHAAIGLGVAKLLMEMKASFSGKIKIIFQPAEEGVRGAASMESKGIVDDVEVLLGMHLGFVGKENNLLVCGVNGFLATSKLDVTFKGIPAHAGAKPEEGKSALLAAAACSLSLQGIYRHSAGASRINVGVLQAGTGRNVVPDHAIMKIETRGVTSEINEFVKKEALRMIDASAKMYDVEVEVKEAGGAMSGESDRELIDIARQVGEASGMFDTINETVDLGGSEDFTYFMDKVQRNGGKSSYLGLGTEIAAGHHDSHFDFNEEVLSTSVAMLLLMTKALEN